MDDEFIATAYPKVHENLKLITGERVPLNDKPEESHLFRVPTAVDNYFRKTKLDDALLRIQNLGNDSDRMSYVVIANKSCSDQVKYIRGIIKYSDDDKDDDDDEGLQLDQTRAGFLQRVVRRSDSAALWITETQEITGAKLFRCQDLILNQNTLKLISDDCYQSRDERNGTSDMEDNDYIDHIPNSVDPLRWFYAKLPERSDLDYSSDSIPGDIERCIGVFISVCSKSARYLDFGLVRISAIRCGLPYCSPRGVNMWRRFDFWEVFFNASLSEMRVYGGGVLGKAQPFCPRTGQGLVFHCRQHVDRNLGVQDRAYYYFKEDYTDRPSQESCYRFIDRNSQRRLMGLNELHKAWRARKWSEDDKREKQDSSQLSMKRSTDQKDLSKSESFVGGRVMRILVLQGYGGRDEDIIVNKMSLPGGWATSSIFVTSVADGYLVIYGFAIVLGVLTLKHSVEITFPSSFVGWCSYALFYEVVLEVIDDSTGYKRPTMVYVMKSSIGNRLVSNSMSAEALREIADMDDRHLWNPRDCNTQPLPSQSENRYRKDEMDDGKCHGNVWSNALYVRLRRREWKLESLNADRSARVRLRPRRVQCLNHSVECWTLRRAALCLRFYVESSGFKNLRLLLFRWIRHRSMNLVLLPARMRAESLKNVGGSFVLGRSDDHFNANEYWLSISSEEGLLLSRSSAENST
ncbi:hypothetical protein Tco_0652009 [Tanacetum coccineum]|uniref:Uncharacterized protein n=1 Tax=Tanacetum coccineum TaxID=301880 RepID=A0ABQ4WWL9_9ASTR